MTLKEKITKDVLDMPLVTSLNKKEISDYENGISRLEQIADDYAIEFANWCEMKMVFSSSVIHKPTYDTLFLQFKKEKGL